MAGALATNEHEEYLMDPNSGRLISEADLTYLRAVDPDEAAKFSVHLTGPAEEVEKIAAAVQRDAKKREDNRRKNKAARAARRAGRR
jgi:hypothetical protein